MPVKKVRIWNTQPRLIQNCTLDRGNKKLLYEYMGSTEFECGHQAKSLRRMFRGKIEMGACTIRAFDRDVEFCIVARKGFPFGKYVQVIQGLVNKEWRTQEPTYLDEVLKKNLRLAKTDIRTEVWFDFTNDALFTLSVANAHSIALALENIKEVWQQQDAWLNSPRVKKFCDELEDIKTRLHKAGKRWIYLGGVEDREGELMVWLNPMLQKTSCGFVSLEDLRNWLKDKGKIAESYRAEQE